MSDEFEETADHPEVTSGGAGTLYFMREVDYLTREMFDYFKIGIVRGAKDVAVREKQHNTGNPRNVVTHLELTCVEVQTLETRLHNRFARHRVSSNEWFHLPGELLKEVVAAAEGFRVEIDAAAVAATQAAATKALPRSGAVVAATNEVLAVAKQLLLKKSELKVVQSNSKSIANLLRSLVAADPSLAVIMKSSQRAASRTFSSELLKKNYKDLYAQFVVPEERLVRDFVFEDDEVQAEALTLRAKTEISAESLEALDAYALHQEYLRLWGEKDRIESEVSLLDDELLIACGDASAISGVIEWNIQVTNRFDKAKFKEQHLDIYEECHKSTEARTTYSVAEWASYRL